MAHGVPVGHHAEPSVVGLDGFVANPVKPRKTGEEGQILAGRFVVGVPVGGLKRLRGLLDCSSDRHPVRGAGLPGPPARRLGIVVLRGEPDHGGEGVAPGVGQALPNPWGSGLARGMTIRHDSHCPLGAWVSLVTSPRCLGSDDTGYWGTQTPWANRASMEAAMTELRVA